MPTIGRYDAERVLGSGAFATVWLAHDDRLDAQVAIKVLAENWSHDADVCRRFQDEARMLWKLDSDRAIRVHAVDEVDGRPYFVMDFADRGSLADRMDARVASDDPFSVDEVLAIAIEIVEALEVVHRLGVVHRDLKPSNVLYRSIGSHHGDTRTERMVLADFGVARALDGATAFTIAGGTPHYMAPEQLEGRADARSDVYAAGVVIYQLLAGRLPYPYESVGAIIRAQMDEVPAPISILRDGVSPSLDAVVAGALAADVDTRYQSATDLLDALRRERDGLASLPDEPRPTDTGTADTIIRPAAGAAAAAAASAGVAGGGASAPPPPAPPSGGGPAGGTGPSGKGGSGSHKKRNRIIAVVLVLLIVGAVAGVALATSGEEATAGEIFLDPRDGASVGNANPFLPSPAITSKAAAIPKTLAKNIDAVPIPKPTGGAIASTSGGEPGLYGGTRDSATCDPTKLLAFLHEHADKAAAWATTMGIGVSQIDGYVADLTSVLLRADTRVTNHGFENGAATAVQSVLEAGTAVLVDKFGVPRVKCFCGNPLREPEAVSAPSYQGPQWTGFAPTAVQVVTPAPQVITVIVVVDVETGEPFGRPIGTDGGSDEDATLPPRGTSSTTTTGPRATTTTKPSVTTTTKATGSADQAVAALRDAFEQCVEQLRAAGNSGDASGIGYSAVPTEENGVFDVTATDPTGSEQGVWRVDLKTNEFTPQDPVAGEVGGVCPALS